MEGTTQELLLDIYYPEGDIDTDRPLIIFVHGGYFYEGSKTGGLEVDWCKRLAKRGYVTASINYRLLNIGWLIENLNTVGIELGFKQEAVQAVHDAKAAIRFFRRTYEEESNPYGIDPNRIILAGHSAGAITTNLVNFMTDPETIPEALYPYISSHGGLEGNSGNCGYDSSPQMVFSSSGGLLDTIAIQSNAHPWVSLHYRGDTIVPNLEGNPSTNVGVTLPFTLQGDSLIYTRLQNIGVPSASRSKAGIGHASFNTTDHNFVINFIHEQVCQQDIGIYTDGLAKPFPLQQFLEDVSSECEVTLEIPKAIDACGDTLLGISNLTFPITEAGSHEVIWTFESDYNTIYQQKQLVVITPIEIVFTQEEGALFLENEGYTYQWVDCNQNYAPIEGETSPMFQPISDGDYAVIVSNGECETRSECLNYTTLNVYQEEFLKLTVFPNPSTKGIFNVNVSESFSTLSIYVTTVLGEKILEFNTEQKKFEIDVSNEPNGLYFLVIKEGGKVYREKIIKQ